MKFNLFNFKFIFFYKEKIDNKFISKEKKYFLYLYNIQF